MFLGRDPSKGKWDEWACQSYCVQELRRAGYFCEGDQNAAKRSYGAAARAKACGMLAGSPDLRIFDYGGVLHLIELKKLKGVVSDPQKEWHAEALKRGFKVHIIKADTPQDMLDKIRAVLIKS